MSSGLSELRPQIIQSVTGSATASAVETALVRSNRRFNWPGARLPPGGQLCARELGATSTSDVRLWSMRQRLGAHDGDADLSSVLN